MVFLDANVFLYAAGREHPLRDPCRRILKKVEEGALPSNTSVEVVQELLYVLWRRGLGVRAQRLAGSVLALFPETLSLTREDLLDAREILADHEGITPRDAVHVATMRNHGIEMIVTADTHFDRVKGIRRIDPSRVMG